MRYLYVILFVIANFCLSGLSAQEIELVVTSEVTLHEVNFDVNGEARVHLKGLVPGDRFEFYLIQAESSPYVTFSSIPDEVHERDPNSLLGVAEDGILTFCLDALNERVKYVQVGVAKNSKVVAPLAGEKMMDNVIQIEETNDIDYMLNTVFRQDTCFALFPGNIFPLARRPRVDSTFIGQSGIFRNGLPTVGIDSGIIISSGNVLDAPGPNSPTNPAGQSWDFINEWNGFDPDADALVAPGRDFFDLVIMDFDFIPTTDTITFNYVFFSEQYCDPLAAGFDADAFGFILTGPDGIPVNIARLPVSGDVVSPATLAPGTPDEAFFVNNTTSLWGARNCAAPDPPPEVLEGINFNGFSRKLTAKGAVIPCARHTLKVIVMDVNDSTIDSGILLEAGSFLASLVNKPEPKTTAQVSRLNPVEGCDTALVTFTRRTLDTPFVNQPLLVKYNIIPIVSGDTTEAIRSVDPNNTAGADYLLPESPFIIPGGDTSATLKIPILADLDFAEGIEAFVIRYDGTCDCTENADTFYIQDNVDFQVTLGDDFVACADEDLTLAATPLGGNGTYTYLWPNGETDSLINYVSTGRDTTIVVSVSDGCGLTGRDSLRILAPSTTASLGGNFPLCENEVADVVVDLEGDGPFTLTLRIDSSGVVTEATYIVTDDSTFQFDYSADVTIASVFDAGGCGGGTDGAAIVRTPDVQLTATVVQPVCNQNLGGIAIETGDGNNNFSFAWSDDASETGANRDQLGPGTYTVAILRSGASCPDSVEFVLQTTPDLVITGFDLTAPACPGETVVLAPLVSGGTPPYAFSWPDSTTTDSLLTVTSINGPATYPVIVTDSCGFSATDSVIFNLPTFDAVVTGRFSLCNDASVDVPLAVTGPPGNYAVVVQIDSAGVTINRPFTLTPGVTFLPFDYPATVTVLSVTNVNSCSGNILPDTARIVDPQITFNGVVTDVNCNLGNDGTITLTDAANVPVTFAWSDGPNTDANRTDLAAGSYTVTVTDAEDASCARDTTFTISAPDAFILQVAADDANCPFELVTLRPLPSGGTAPYTFSWPDSMTTDSVLIITTRPGTTSYPVEVSDACGIVLRDSFSISLSDTRAEVSGNYSVCNPPFNTDVPFIFSGNGPFTFVIAENGVARTLVLRNGQDTSLNYVDAVDIQLLSVTGGDGCPGTAGGIANVTDGTFAVVAEVRDVLCTNDTTGMIDLVVNGNNMIYAFNWERPGLDGPSVSGLAAGLYGLTVTDLTPDACSWDTSFLVLEPAAAIQLSRDSLRNEDCRQSGFASATYGGGTGDITYAWSNGTAGRILGEVAAGSYTLSVTDANGCLVTQPFDIRDERTEVLAGISQSAVALTCAEPTLDLVAQQNTQTVGWEWRDADGSLISDLRQATVGAAGRYYLTVTNPDNGCFAVDSIDVAASGDLLTLELEPEALISCVSSSVGFEVSHPNFSGAVTYRWRFNGAVIGNTAGLTDITTIGTYEVTVRREDNGCEAVALVEVRRDINRPVVSVLVPVVTTSCRAPEATIAVNANGPFSFEWSTANGNITGANGNRDILIDQPGTYRVVVTDTINGCTTMADVSVVTDGATLTPDAGTDQPLLCTGRGTVLNGSIAPQLDNTEVRWFAPDGEIIGEDNQVFSQVPGAHVLEVIHPLSGCSSFDTVMVFSEAPTSVRYSLQQPPCPEVGGRLFVTGVTGLNPPFTFSSPTGETEPFGGGLRGLRVGTNVLVVTDQYGCELRDTFQMFSGFDFTGEADDVTIVLGEEATLGVTTNRDEGEIVSYAWSNLNDTLACHHCPDPTVFPLESFIAEVTIIDSNGCELTLRQNVVVGENELIYMPTAFSPGNGDGVNDIYTVFGNREFVQNVNWFRIFDRWGSLVHSKENFEVNDPDAGWNGAAPDGRGAPLGAYAYTVSYVRWDNVTVVKTGGFTLVR